MEKKIIGFGIAGNFAHHLEQAGESEDFIGVEVDSEDAPKGIFPTYIPNENGFLGIYPFSTDSISFIDDKNIQMEPEVALRCSISYDKNRDISSLIPLSFMAYNDCSIRVEGAKKISHKKNWGKNSKGISNQEIEIDKFTKGGVMDQYSLTSFIKRDNRVIQYGENSELLGYSYFYEKLQQWIINKLNTQKEQGPLENLKSLIKIAQYPKELLISIGATRYTPFGEKNFLETDDTIFVIVYNHTLYKHDDIIKMVETEIFNKKSLSILKQKIIK